VSPPRGVMIARFKKSKAISGSLHDLESKTNYVDQRLDSRSLRSAFLYGLQMKSLVERPDQFRRLFIGGRWIEGCDVCPMAQY